MKKPQALFTAQGAYQNHAGVLDSTASKANRVDPLLSKETDTKSQIARFLAAVRRGPKTSCELRALGIYQVSARAWAIRQMGYALTTELFDGVSADGYARKRMARYSLHEPATTWREDQAANGGE